MVKSVRAIRSLRSNKLYLARNKDNFVINGHILTNKNAFPKVTQTNKKYSGDKYPRKFWINTKYGYR
jgi:hypothetical protein